MTTSEAWLLSIRRDLVRRIHINPWYQEDEILDAPAAEREAIGGLAMRLTKRARARYALHRRILSDLDAPEARLNQKLTAWWDLSFPAFRDEVKKAVKREIAVRERDDWEEWLEAQRARHREHTDAIVRPETLLNARLRALRPES
jgi:hypothetical protein